MTNQTKRDRRSAFAESCLMAYVMSRKKPVRDNSWPMEPANLVKAKGQLSRKSRHDRYGNQRLRGEQCRRDWKSKP
jgi:hypothetical protein